jgi:hypothetical protein
MNRKTLAAVAAALFTTIAFTGAAQAQNTGDEARTSMLSMARMDMNKDKMISKAEFLAMMAKVWDMKAKEMKLKADLATEAEMRMILQYLSAGG